MNILRTTSIFFIYRLYEWTLLQVLKKKYVQSTEELTAYSF